MHDMSTEQHVTKVSEWLVARLAKSLRMAAEDVDASATFSQLGVSSLQAVELVTELEDEFGIELPVTLFYDYPTVQAVARHVAGALEGAAAHGTSR
jgi:Acyl carrier protein